MTEGFEWTPEDVYDAQTMCSYETVAYGFSVFCDLFTYKEWQAFGYSVDLAFSASNSFHSPTGVSLLQNDLHITVRPLTWNSEQLVLDTSKK